MKRQNGSDASVLSARNCLGQTCGTNIDTEDVDFTDQQPNLVFMDKVFSFNKDTASPILFNLDTGGEDSDLFVTQLFLDGSSLFPCTLSPNAVFEIDNSFVVVEYFNTRPPGNINTSQVTLDGFPVDLVSFANGQYTARIQNVLTRVQKDRCLDRGLPTKAFFLINNAGPWDLRATYVLEGTVNTNGRTCRFRVEISNAPDAPNTMLPGGNLSTFAVPDLSLPCSINGIAPDIFFQFNAKINLVNPRLIVDCDIPLMENGAESAGAAQASRVGSQGRRHCWRPIISPILINPCTVNLVTSVAAEPVLHVQTVRRTLFCVNACEGVQPCQGSVLAAEIADDMENCEIGGVDRPDCRCRKNGSGCDTSERGDTTEEFPRRRRNGVAGATTNPGNPLADIIGVNNRDVDGVTVGAGTCDDCVWGETEGHNCKPCRRGRNETAGSEGRRRSRSDDVLGIADRRFKNSVLGTTEINLIKKLLREIRDELEEETGDVAGIGYGTDGTLGVEEEVTASRRNGCNGCSW